MKSAKAPLTCLFEDVEETPNSERTSDANAKNILRYKCVLARILKFAVPDFSAYSIEDIEERIASDSNNSKYANIEAIESSHTGISTVRFDIRTDFNIDSHSSVILNFEAQNVLRPSENGHKYSLAQRGMYYLARLLTDQLSKGDNDYSKLRKCYSIWIVFRPAGNEAQILYYTMKNKGDKTLLAQEYEDYVDLAELVFIILGENTQYRDIFSFLEGLFKKPEMLSDYIPKTIDTGDLYEEVSTMCNMRDIGYEEGIEQGIEQGVEKGIYAMIRTLRRLKLSDEQIVLQICEEFKLTAEEAREYLSKAS